MEIIHRKGSLLQRPHFTCNLYQMKLLIGRMSVEMMTRDELLAPHRDFWKC
jgi:hypothetical protein